MDRNTLRQALVVVAYVATVALNGLANALPLNGQTTGEISDRFAIYFVPAGYVFSIWSLIYLGLLAYVIYQALPSQRENPRLQRTGLWFALSSAANIAWLFLWHYETFPLTVVAMVALLATLIVIYLRLGVGQADVPAGERWLVHLPFSIYLGWVTVATIGNVTTLLDFLGWNGWGVSPEAWAVIMLAVTLGLAAIVSLKRADIAYLLVLIWALAGIAVKHSATPLVATAAWVTTGLVAVVLVAGRLRRARARPAPSPAG